MFRFSSNSHEGDADEYSRKDYIRSMEKKFGWEIIEHDAPSQTHQSEAAPSNGG
jgi:hypothetical protein